MAIINYWQTGVLAGTKWFTINYKIDEWISLIIFITYCYDAFLLKF